MPPLTPRINQASLHIHMIRSAYLPTERGERAKDGEVDWLGVDHSSTLIRIRAVYSLVTAPYLTYYLDPHTPYFMLSMLGILHNVLSRQAIVIRKCL